MDVDQTQELEIEALKAIYGDDFQDAPPSKVWKVRDQLVLSSLATKPPAIAAHFLCQINESNALSRVLRHTLSSSFG